MFAYTLPTALPGSGDLTRFPGSSISPFNLALGNLQEWVREDLARLNGEIELNGLDSGALIAAATPLLSQLQSTIPSNPDKWIARAGIQAIAMTSSSAERHFQALGHVHSVGKNLLPYAEELLTTLGRFAKKAPRDTTHDYWHWNRGPQPFRFTGMRWEDAFRDRVNLTFDLHAASTAALRPIATGEVHPFSPEAQVIYSMVESNTNRLCEEYRAMTEPINGQWPIPHEFFRNRYRQYLTRYSVGGIEYAGVNAANVAPQLSLDYLLGMTDPSYAAIVEKTFPYQTQEDLLVLEQDMKLPSVTERIFQALDYQTTLAEPGEKRWVALRIAERSPKTLEVLSAYTKAIHEARRLTGIHFQLISAFLVKPVTTQSNAVGERSSGDSGAPALPVPAENGTGGRSHADTKAIMSMRRNQPIISLLVTSINDLQEARRP